jgi:hypothetical protein
MKVHELLNEDLGPEIQTRMKNAGYKHLGDGSQASVWTKEKGKVTKIVMADDVKGSVTVGEKALRLFIEYVSKRQSNPHLPKIFKVDGVYMKPLTVGGKEFIEVDIEELQELGKFEKYLINKLTTSMDYRKRVSIGPAWYEKLRMNIKRAIGSSPNDSQKIPPNLEKQLQAFLILLESCTTFLEKIMRHGI